jgi:hypothetical protein
VTHRPCYRGFRTGRRTTINGPAGRIVAPAPEDGCWASPLVWGAAGPGAVRTALAILFDHLTATLGLSQQEAGRVADAFKEDFADSVVAFLPEQWVMQTRAVEEFRQMVLRRRGGLPIDWNLWRASALERQIIVDAGDWLASKV